MGMVFSFGMLGSVFRLIVWEDGFRLGGLIGGVYGFGLVVGLSQDLVSLASIDASTGTYCSWDSPVTIVESGGLISFTKSLVSDSGPTLSSSGRFSIVDSRSELEFALIGLWENIAGIEEYGRIEEKKRE
ncbi:hypothetical protein LWI29_035915 [Acer saccharum]|uniref:Uncharacterized protein n=1 Tax=Acer saccharum TaxID=4024 RepID=A0AA39VI28_ACESA|nr:hypothetical protein LWI29_035915 [Acer saccharum]